MALAWVVQQRTGNSGWVDTIWTFAVGLVGAGGALWPVTGGARTSKFFPWPRTAHDHAQTKEEVAP